MTRRFVKWWKTFRMRFRDARIVLNSGREVFEKIGYSDGMRHGYDWRKHEERMEAEEGAEGWIDHKRFGEKIGLAPWTYSNNVPLDPGTLEPIARFPSRLFSASIELPDWRLVRPGNRYPILRLHMREMAEAIYQKIREDDVCRVANKTVRVRVEVMFPDMDVYSGGVIRERRLK